ncbi:aminoglycoside phosphotransferase family protein [Natronosporangium hydrolyticum]|uniref:Aminoglycoside phosphotransferase family protein n=1 Tax=Natronosporangium hydrolyticum TaxID=2811111 RepID=A0A895YGS0_9ACTN|nr:aminoglycoside phosphotransferase family protein [Natronosporangium hydrolyticum]QSB14593.1 aminoglycoside phosphotransferase family protein [Natronosporangium hydrolyticum]
MWEQRAMSAARRAATARGLDSGGSRMVRVGENAVVHLSAAGVMAKVVPDEGLIELVRHELAVAQWLASADVPVMQPVAEEPVIIDGCVVALWEYLPEARSADLITLARFLRRLHAAPIPDSPALPSVQPFSRLQERLTSAVTLNAADRSFLAALGNQLSEQWKQATFDLPTTVVHGDAHMDNLLVTDGADGRLAFVDLEHVAVGPPEWDLTLTALYYECGWFTADQYRSFTGEYGFDVRMSAAWPVLRGIRMLRMTTWLAQTAADYPERQAQLEHRIASLRDDSAPAGWTGF